VRPRTRKTGARADAAVALWGIKTISAKRLVAAATGDSKRRWNGATRSKIARANSLLEARAGASQRVTRKPAEP